MNTPDPDSDFDTLWTSFLEGDLDAAGWEKLHAILDADPDKMAAAADLYRSHRLLGHHFDDADADSFVADTMKRLPDNADAFVADFHNHVSPKRTSVPWIRYAAAAAVAVAATLALQSLFTSKPTIAQTPAPITFVATLVETQTTVRSGDRLLTGGQRLSPGELHIAAGRAKIHFDCGATAILEGPAVLDVESAIGATLSAGQATVRAPEEAFGFTLRTPTSDVVDLGTEFSVNVGTGGETDIHVHDGLVQAAASDAPDASHLLAEGQALHIGADDIRTIALDAESFDDLDAAFLQDNSSNTPAGKLLAYDGFDYPATLKAHQPDGGTGWSGGWIRGGFSLDHLSLNFDPATSLTTAAPLHTTGGSALLTGTDGLPHVYKRILENPVQTGQDSIRYFSFLLQRPLDARNDGAVKIIWTQRENWRVRFGCGIRGARPFTFAAGVQNSFGTSGIKRGQTVLFVGKIVTSQHAPDEIFLATYLDNQQPTHREPARWDIIGQPQSMDLPLDEIHIGFTPGSDFRFDEFRLGTTWTSVLPKN